MLRPIFLQPGVNEGRVWLIPVIVLIALPPIESQNVPTFAHADLLQFAKIRPEEFRHARLTPSAILDSLNDPLKIASLPLEKERHIMNPSQSNNESFLRRMRLLSLLILSLSLRFTIAEPNLVIWDTHSRISEPTDIQNRAAWKAVPTNPFELEADPAKASSDPGYYGQEYLFKGDMVIENRTLAALFSSPKGEVVLVSKDPAGAHSLANLAPLGTKSATIRSCSIIRNSADEAVVEVLFSGDDSAQLPFIFSFGKTEIIEIKPPSQVPGLAIHAPVDYGIVPAFVGDDLIFGASESTDSSKLFLPADNLFLALLKGENHQLVMTWPKGEQRLRLSLGEQHDGKRPIASIEFENDGKSLFLSPQSAPGIWHKETLTAAYLEQDVASNWKPPFPARWQTQLTEAGVKARFAFRPSKGTVWRGVPGSYNYPVWFDGDSAYYHLSKKVPPKGESIIYFLEGQDTPMSILTPADILKATLGRPESEPILDVEGRKSRTHHRRGPKGTRRACTCGCTEVIQAFFEKGQETSKKSDIQEAVDDMIFFVQCHVERIDEYRAFASNTVRFLKAEAKASPDLQPVIENLQQIAEQIEQEYSVQKENMKSLEHARDLAEQTMMLTAKSDPKNLASYMDLLKAWRAMGGAQDYIVAQCHTITRKLFQEASYAASIEPKALKLAQSIRTQSRQILRNADGYEIWPNY
jgi:hypothetical protein